MEYQLWQVCSMGLGDEPMPLILIDRATGFEEIYTKFLKQINKESVPCVIVCEKGKNK